MANKVYIIDAIRTPIGNFGGSLKEYSAPKLGSILIKNLLLRYNLQKVAIDGVILGNVLQAGLGQNPARHAALDAELSCNNPCLTVNKVCGSALKAIDIAYRNIASGYGKLYIAGGIESMSNAPYLLKGARWGYKIGDSKIIDEMVTDGLWCPFSNVHMGELTDRMAREFAIFRDKQDEFAFYSHKKAIAAIESGRFLNEIIPVDIKNKKGNIISSFNIDEHPRKDTTPEKLSSLKPAFTKDGTVTAGNSSGINDGAAILLLCSEDKLGELGISPMAQILEITEVGTEPAYFGTAPVYAVKKALKNLDVKIGDIELAEFNEAFAAQSLYVIKNLSIDKDIVNVNGGAIALGHPIGASGARIVVTLAHEMQKRQSSIGIASLCIGSGEGMAIVLKGFK
ncbi:MAG: acetyl-CoA C-acetyltransferase [Actinobacteria bacterium]|nr:acetyl-CoA C-acetyltransferase [Actinomycetota bacterium]